MQLLNTLLVLGFIAFILWRIEPYIKSVMGLAERSQALKERTLEAKVKASEKPAPPMPDPIPAELLVETMLESEPWAREQAQKVLHEQFRELGSWDQVRIARHLKKSYD